MGSDGGRYRKACPSGDRQQCRLRVLYINHITEEATLHCPCGTCSPDWRWGPCNTLGLLYGEDEPGLLEENGDPVIPAQGLTRVGNPCLRLGDPYNEDSTKSLELEDDSVIPAQEVGLHIFDDIPGFALARNHLALTAQDPPLVASTQESQPLAAAPSYSGLLTSPSTVVSTKSFFSLLVSHTATESTSFQPRRAAFVCA